MTRAVQMARLRLRRPRRVGALAGHRGHPGDQHSAQRGGDGQPGRSAERAGRPVAGDHLGEVGSEDEADHDGAVRRGTAVPQRPGEDGATANRRARHRPRRLRGLGRDAHRSAPVQRPRSTQGVLEHVDPIGEDAVHPGVDQPLHLDAVVDRPHVHVLAGAVHRVDQAAGQHLQPATEDPTVDRQLQDRGRGVEHGGHPGHEPVHGDADRAGGAGHPGPSSRRSRCSRRMPNELTQTRSCASCSAMVAASSSIDADDLASMLKRASGKASSSSGQRGDGVAAADPGAPDHLVRRPGDQARGVGDPVQPGVVEGDQHPVGRWRARRSRGSGSRGRRPRRRRAGCSPDRGSADRGRRRGGRAQRRGRRG